jgi:hypothetical protein
MRRRNVIGLLGGAAALWPRPVWGQQGRVRRIGVLNNVNADNADRQAQYQDFRRGTWARGVGRRPQP